MDDRRKNSSDSSDRRSRLHDNFLLCPGRSGAPTCVCCLAEMELDGEGIRKPAKLLQIRACGFWTRGLSCIAWRLPGLWRTTFRRPAEVFCRRWGDGQAEEGNPRSL